MEVFLKLFGIPDHEVPDTSQEEDHVKEENTASSHSTLPHGSG